MNLDGIRREVDDLMRDYDDSPGLEALVLLCRARALVDTFTRRPGVGVDDIRGFLHDVDAFLGITADQLSEP